MDKVQAFGKNFTYAPTSSRNANINRTVDLSALAISCADDGRRASFTPFAARTQQYVKEQLGQAEDKVR
jgi:hypothetical protein